MGSGASPGSEGFTDKKFAGEQERKLKTTSTESTASVLSVCGPL